MLVIDARDAEARPAGLSLAAPHFDGDLRWFEVLARHGLSNAQRAELWMDGAEAEPTVLPVLRDAGDGRALANFYTACYAPRFGQEGSSALVRIFETLRRETRLSRLELRPMAHDSPEFDATREALHVAGWRTFAFFCFGNWYRPLDGRGYDDLQAGLPGQVRSTIRRKGRRFAAAGGRLEILTGKDRTEAAVAAFQQVYARSWKRPEPFPDFMPEFIRLSARAGWMRMGVAWLGEHPIAAQLWIVYRGVASIYKLAYDERHAAFSAGTLLTDCLMRHVVDADAVREVDYLIGDETYKQDWMSHRRERWGLMAFNPGSARGFLGWQAEALRAGVKRLLGRGAMSGLW